MQELDEDFMDTSVGQPLLPLEWPTLIDEQAKENHQQKISVAFLQHDSEEDSIRDLERALGVTPREREGEEINITNGHVEERRLEEEQRQSFEVLFY